MRHSAVTDEVRDLAAHYALRTLSDEDTVRFEAHLAAGCRACEEEVRACAATVGLIGATARAVAPPASLRERLIARVAREEATWAIVRAGEMRWERDAADRRWRKVLFRDPAEDRITTLVRLEPGAGYPGDRSHGHEELYVLEGDLRVQERALGPGDYCVAIAGSVRGAARTDGGCTFLRWAAEQGERAESGDGAGLLFVGSTAEGWRETDAPGVAMRRLFKDPRDGAITALVRMSPGARLPGHRHLTAEQFYVIEGDAHVGGQDLSAGDYYRSPRASLHDVSYTDGGCTFILLASRLELLALPPR